jgi:VanZ family protein
VIGLPRLLRDDATARRRWRALLIFGLGLAAVLAFGPPTTEAGDTTGDKWQHVAAFAALGVAAGRALPAGWSATWRATAGLLAYGVLIEAVQSQLPLRSASVADVLADAAGIALGLALAALLPRTRS